MTDKKIQLVKINNEDVQCPRILLTNQDKPIKGESIFCEPYPNVFIVARKKSGKSVVIAKILKEKCGPNTKVVIFCSTHNKDVVWKSIKQWCKKHNIKYFPYHSIEDIKDGKKNIIDIFCDKMKEVEEDESEEEEKDDGLGFKPKYTNNENERTSRHCNFSNNPYYEEDMYEEDNNQSSISLPFVKNEETSLQGPEEKELAPEYIFVFDDLSTELRAPSIVSLMKKNRHYKLMNIFSSQYHTDLQPASKSQCDYSLLFGGLDSKKLERIRKDFDLRIDEEEFSEIYKDATREKYNFLYIDIRNDHYRKNFNKQYIIND